MVTAPFETRGAGDPHRRRAGRALRARRARSCCERAVQAGASRAARRRPLRGAQPGAAARRRGGPVARGIPLPAALSMIEQVKRNCEAVSQRIREALHGRAVEALRREGQPEERWEDVIESIERLRPLASEALLGHVQADDDGRGRGRVRQGARAPGQARALSSDRRPSRPARMCSVPSMCARMSRTAFAVESARINSTSRRCCSLDFVSTCSGMRDPGDERAHLPCTSVIAATSRGDCAASAEPDVEADVGTPVVREVLGIRHAIHEVLQALEVLLSGPLAREDHRTGLDRHALVQRRPGARRRAARCHARSASGGCSATNVPPPRPRRDTRWPLCTSVVRAWRRVEREMRSCSARSRSAGSWVPAREQADANRGAQALDRLLERRRRLDRIEHRLRGRAALHARQRYPVRSFSPPGSIARHGPAPGEGDARDRPLPDRGADDASVRGLPQPPVGSREPPRPRLLHAPGRHADAARGRRRLDTRRC